MTGKSATEHGDSRPGNGGAASRSAAALAGRTAAYVILLIMVGVPLAQTVAGHLQPGSGALERLPWPPTAEALRELERGIEERSDLSRWLQVHYSVLLDRLLQRGNAKVHFGRGGWLFYREALRYATGPALESPRARRLLEPEGAGPRAAILDFQRQLRRRGIELLLIPVPTKATLYPEKLWPAAAPGFAPRNPGFEPLLAALEREGVRVFRPEGPLREAKEAGTEVFLPRDTHWSPAGARLVAEALAARVAELGLLGEGRHRFGRRKVRFEGSGDLADMLSHADVASPFPPMQLALEQVVAAADGTEPIGGEEAPVLLLGDSLTNIFSAPELGMGRRGGFAEHLAAALGRPVDVIASPGGGASGARRNLSLRPRGLAGKELVLWQLTERDLLVSPEGWQLVELPEAGDRPSPAAAVHEPIRVVGKVTATTPLPERRDYAECLLVVRYELLEGTLPGPDGAPFFVAYWGWRDWRPTPESRFREGEVHTLDLAAIDAHADLETTCWIEEVEMSEKPWWAVSTTENRSRP